MVRSLRSAVVLVAVALTPLVGAQTASPTTERGEDPWFDTALPELVELYKHFHRHPELSFREVKTSQRLAAEFERAGLTVTQKVGGLGVVALLENGEGPTVMVRCDMDALPVAEQTGLDYASTVNGTSGDGRPIGIMHACGHDVHMTTAVGAARWLADHRDRWRGTLMVIGQPAEERSGGAKAMLGDGLFERFPKPDYAIALHVTNELATGVVGYRAGPAMANVDSVDVWMFGKGGHGAAPHTTIDPVVQAAQLVLDLQTLVSRELAPTDPAVVTVGAIQGGAKHNIISDRCHLQITVRSYSDTAREHLKEGIVRKANAIAASARAPAPKVEFSEGTPALANDAALVDRVVEVFRATFGDEHVVGVEPVMTAEDFARYGRVGVPIFMFRLGTIAPERLAKLKAAGGSPSLHSGFYYPDPEDSIRTGVTAFAVAVLELMERG